MRGAMSHHVYINRLILSIKMYWQELSSPQIAALARSLPVVAPLGSCEPHGRHLPLGVDAKQVTAITKRPA